MKPLQIFSRRSNAVVDFRPDMTELSPHAQIRRLSHLLAADVAPAEDITDCPEALSFLREFVYRKTFTGCTHEQYLETDKHHPEAIDWLLAVADVENERFAAKKSAPRPR